MKSYLTSRDTELLDCLTRQMPFLVFTDIARIWWPKSASLHAARKRMNFLRTAGFLIQRIVNGPDLSVARLAAWRPNDLVSDPMGVAHAAMNVCKSPTQPIEIYEASNLAANCFGCPTWGSRDIWSAHVHFLLAEVFVSFRLRHPELARGWLTSRSQSANVVFATLHDENDQPTRNVFCVARCTDRTIARIHDRCKKAALPYELWGGAA